MTASPLAQKVLALPYRERERLLAERSTAFTTEMRAGVMPARR